MLNVGFLRSYNAIGHPRSAEVQMSARMPPTSVEPVEPNAALSQSAYVLNIVIISIPPVRKRQIMTPVMLGDKPVGIILRDVSAWLGAR